jgi:hypothetical protein
MTDLLMNASQPLHVSELGARGAEPPPQTTSIVQEKMKKCLGTSLV